MAIAARPAMVDRTERLVTAATAVLQAMVEAVAATVVEDRTARLATAEAVVATAAVPTARRAMVVAAIHRVVTRPAAEAAIPAVPLVEGIPVEAATPEAIIRP